MQVRMAAVPTWWREVKQKAGSHFNQRYRHHNHLEKESPKTYIAQEQMPLLPIPSTTTIHPCENKDGRNLASFQQGEEDLGAQEQFHKINLK